MTPKPTAKYIRTLDVYRHFAEQIGTVEKDGDLERQFVFESYGPKRYAEIYGSPFNENNNFYAVGKKWKEWQITNWLDDLKPDKPFLFGAHELWLDYADKPYMIEMMESAIYPNLSKFQQMLVDDVRKEDGEKDEAMEMADGQANKIHERVMLLTALGAIAGAVTSVTLFFTDGQMLLFLLSAFATVCAVWSLDLLADEKGK